MTEPTLDIQSRPVRVAIPPAAIAFAVRTTGATLLALWLSFRLSLGFPYWSAVTVWLVSRPTLQPTLRRSVARFLGVIVGCVGTILLVAFVAQSPILGIILVALWIGGCAGGATLAHEQSRAYGFQLAGFTMLSAISSSITQPNAALLIVLDQFAAVVVGLAAVFVVETLLPYGITQPTPKAGPPGPGAPRDAVRSALIAIATVLVAGSFWIATAWPHGALFVFAAGLVSVFYATQPAPDVSTVQFIIATALASGCALLYAFILLPPFSDFVPLAALLTPMLIIGGVVLANQRVAQKGGMVFMAFTVIFLQLTNTRRVEPVTLLNSDFAYITGGLVGMAMFRLGGRGVLP